MLQHPGRQVCFAPFIHLLCSASVLFLFTLLLLTDSWHLPTAQATASLASTPVATPLFIQRASQELVDVDAGRVVWQDTRFGASEIYLWTPTAPEGINLTNTPHDWEAHPDLDGEMVVWKDGYQGIGIHGLNLTTQRTFTVTVGQHGISRPRLSDQIVVWADNRKGNEEWNIYGYDVAAAQEFTITAATGNQSDPQIDWPWVVWWDFQERIYAHNLQSGVTQTILATHGARLPAVSAADQLVIWQDMRNGNWDLYGYDLATNQEIEIVKAPGDQGFVELGAGLVAFQTQRPNGAWNVALWARPLNRHFVLEPHSAFQTQPAVDGTLVVWQDSRNHQLDIYAYSWQGTPPLEGPSLIAPPANLQVGALPQRAILLQWEDQTVDEAGFRIERATGITGTTWTALAEVPAGTVTYVDHPDALDETYWYRVRAFTAAATSAYSNESFGTTFATTPSADELYLMTLINEARADPAHFGYRDHDPVPPLVYKPLLAYTAHSHSQAILNSTFQFGHCDIIGRCPTERARAVGYQGNCAENLTTTGTTGAAAMREANQGFLASEPHRKNMLAPDLTEFGVGHTFDPNKGDERHGQVTEIFCGGESPIPVLPSGAMVAPSPGDSTFTFVVNYYSATGQPPTSAQVIIDGQRYPLRLRSGKAAHGTYEYRVELDARAQHNYHFRFDYGDGKVAEWSPNGVVPNHFLYLPFVNR